MKCWKNLSSGNFPAYEIKGQQFAQQIDFLIDSVGTWI